MSEKVSETVNNVCTLLGGALLLYPLIDQAAKTLIPEMQKLKSGETLQELKMLPAEQEKHYIPEHKPHDDSIAELKRKLAEYESKFHEQQSANQ